MRETDYFGGKIIFSDIDPVGGLDEVDIMSSVYAAIKEKTEEKNEVVYFDIGARLGHFSILPKLFENVTGCSFEPNPNSFKVLNENIKCNGLADKMKVFNIGVSSINKKLELKVPNTDDTSGISTFAKTPTLFENVNANAYSIYDVHCKTLDTVFNLLSLKSIDVIKIDTEGSEFDIITGGEGVLSKFKPTIIMEYQDHNANEFGHKRDECVEQLKTYGYTSFEFVPGRDSDLICK